MVPRPSRVWEYFERFERDGDRISKCRLCDLELKSHQASNAKRHLRAIHGETLYDAVEQADRTESFSKPHTLEKRIGDMVQVRIVMKRNQSIRK